MNPKVAGEERSGEKYARTLKPALIALLPVITLAPAFGSLGTLARLIVGLVVVAAVLAKPARLAPIHVVAAVLLVAVTTAHALSGEALMYGIVRSANLLMFLPLIALPFAPSLVRAVFKSLVVACWLQILGVMLQFAGAWGGTWGGLVVSGSTVDPSSLRWLKRYTGFLQNPNDLGLLLALGIIVCLTLVAFRSLDQRQRLLIWGSIAAFTAGIAASGSRGAIVAVAAGVTVVAFYSKARHRLAVLLGTVIAAAIALQSREFSYVAASFGGFVSGTDVSASQRQQLWQEMLRQNEAWLVGGGFGGYVGSGAGNVASGFILDDSVQKSATVDNAWLKLLLEMGVLGVGCFVLLLVATLSSALGKRGAAGTGVRAAVLGSAVALVSRSLTADIFDVNPWNAAVYVVAGLAVGLGRWSVSRSRSSSARGMTSQEAVDGTDDRARRAGSRRALGDGLERIVTDPSVRSMYWRSQ